METNRAEELEALVCVFLHRLERKGEFFDLLCRHVIRASSLPSVPLRMAASSLVGELSPPTPPHHTQLQAITGGRRQGGRRSGGLQEAGGGRSFKEQLGMCGGTYTSMRA